MSISDELMWRWFELLSFISEAEIKNLRKQVDDGTNPRDIKFILAEELLIDFIKKGMGRHAKNHFYKDFKKEVCPKILKKFH
jgi:tyrosyl-tRNA synthetase